MGELKIEGDEIYFNAYRLGKRPPGMPETQWARVVDVIVNYTEPEDEDGSYRRGYDDGYLDGLAKREKQDAGA